MNEALGRLRRERLAVDLDTFEAQRTEAQIIQFPQTVTSDDPERTMAQREILQLVERATDNLPEIFRIVFITRVIEGMSVEETADLLGLRPETVKTRLHRAWNELCSRTARSISSIGRAADNERSKPLANLSPVTTAQNRSAVA